jgi:SAM-dependent methyltransferase
MKCEVCKSNNPERVLDLSMHPLCDDLIPIGSEDHCDKFHIEIALCPDCLTALQLHAVPKRRLFPSSYHYRSGLTQDVLNGMQDLVNSVKHRYGSLAGKTVIDIGCNDGSLLKLFRAEGAVVLGIEPTDAGSDAMRQGIPVLNGFFDPSTARTLRRDLGGIDYVTFTNVFAHIENIDELLESVSILLGEKTHLIIENHYLGSVLKRFQFDTFYHEHPRTYSATSFWNISRRLGRSLEVVEFPARYGGDIRVMIGPKSAASQPSPEIQAILQTEKGFVGRFREMRDVIHQWVESRSMLLERVRCVDGRVYAKAFPGRAAILMQMLGLDERDIAAVFEKPSSKKIGHYVPGTRVPILSDEELLKTVPVPRRVLNLAWHIGGEIRSYLQTFDKDLRCIDIFGPDSHDRG